MMILNKICIISILSERLHVGSERVLDIFYSSRTNEHLHDSSTGLSLMIDRYIVDEIVLELQGR